jgi:diguanylate cyclase (GGDEF)-like protein/PAS domain S-box-containing protein
LLARQPKLDVLRFSNEDGDILSENTGRITSTDNIAKRDFFIRLRDDPTAGLVVAKPFIGKSHNQWTLVFARRLSETDGSFGGVVFGGIVLKQLQQLFSKLEIGRHGTVSLRDIGLESIVRNADGGDPASDIGQKSQSEEFRMLLETGQQSSIFTSASIFGGGEETVAVRRIGFYPLYVTVTLSAEDYLSDWRSEAIKVTAFVGLFLILTLAVFWQLLQGWKRQAAAYQLLRDSEERLRLLASNATDTICRIALDGTYLDVSKSAIRLLGYPGEELVGRKIADFIHPDDLPLVQNERDTLIANAEPRIMTHRYRQKDGRQIWIESNTQAVKDEKGQVVEFVAVSRDITERKLAEAQIEYLAHHDPLTKLPNRLLGKDRLDIAIARAERANSKAALLFLDLDQFKRVNDSLGHSVGDALLQSVATRLLLCLRNCDTLSRQGGDEFLILLDDLRDTEAASRVAEAVLESLTSPFVIEGHELYISGSIGIAVYPNDGTDFDTLLKKADTAMYHAKEIGRNAFRFFTDQMNVDASEYLGLRTGLRRALERREFLLHYQPQISLRTGAVVGVEALVRWQRPGVGLVPPARFIPVAEDSGLIVPLGAWVLREACLQAAKWHKMGFENLVVAVNLSATQFKRGDLLNNISGALAESKLDPTCLELELTESILITDTKAVLSMVERLKLLGVKLSIDDFGTGYSSLSYLKQFNVDKLKIDQSFVRDITTDPNDAAIVFAIVQMAHSLGLTTVAEGVEEEAAVAKLQERGCDEAQGYFFAKPMPADALAEFLRQHVPLGQG